MRLATTGKELGDTVTARITEATETLRGWSDQEFNGNISQRVSELVEDPAFRLPAPGQRPGGDVAESVSTRVSELTDSLRTLSDPLKPGGPELAANISGRITELNEMLNGVAMEPKRKKSPRR